MSDLRPKGKKVWIGGEEHELLFSLNVIDAMQSFYNETAGRVLLKLTDEMRGPEVLRFLLTELLNDEKQRRNDHGFYKIEEIGSMVSRKEIPELTRSVINAYEEAVPKEQEKTTEEGELLDIAGLILIATTKMGYSEEEVFAMTPKKFFLLFESFLSMNGKKKKDVAPILMLP